MLFASLVSGTVDSVFVTENARVQKGDKIFTVRANVIAEQSDNSRQLLREYNNQQRDLEKLIKLTAAYDWDKVPTLQSPDYQQEANFFYARLKELKNQFEITKRDFKRNEGLHQAGAISDAEFDQVSLYYENAKNTLLTAYSQQAAIWQSNLNQIRILIQDLSSRTKQLKEEQDFYTITAPVDGFVQDIRQLFPGANVAAGESLGDISPEGALLAEVLVSPKDIGFLRKDSKVKMQVDAFNYNEWGFLEGTLVEISNDVFVEADGQPYFRVRCALDRDYMELKNGYQGNLMKGMTVQARFSFTRRRVANLLFDKVDDWINPNLVANR
ncbi:secretion protein HlyD family protein [Nitritalea halalkaliphila LW7]|uniref:Secretion protein HlyD family protein n=1 Tax=Nitritalea halalkaliphila LW7 TaxID=1189621 RepID=I5BT63_9BACT|nr:HlyD family efflux transporter periplasmic adaptor subunit [Nitritalea halalkaliphila]EIM72765.1 secretion protein HlyD family protein [Nitritalea halalkaliphila LW7]